MNTSSSLFRPLVRVGLLATALVCSSLSFAQEAGEDDAAFQALIQQVRSGKAMIDDIVKLNDMAIENGQAFAANLAVKGFLRRQIEPEPAVLREAAEIAALAGDVRMAVNRYKAYLRDAPSSKESSDAAAHAYELMIEYLKTSQDAYQLMLELEGKHRQTVAARKFDRWFIHEAIRRHAYETAVSMLTTVVSDVKGPVKNEWNGTFVHLVRSMLANAEKYPDAVRAAAPELQQAVRSMSEIEGHKRYCRLGAEYLLFLKRIAEEEATGKVDHFKPVEQMAKKWIDEDPSQVTVAWMLRVFAGDDVNQGVLKRHWDVKGPLFDYAFGKLEAERDWMLDHEALGPMIDWQAHTRQHPELSKRISWQDASAALVKMSRDELAAYRKALGDVDSAESAMLTALAENDAPMKAARSIWEQTGSEGAARPLFAEHLPTIMKTWYGDKFDAKAYYTALWKEQVVPFVAAHYYRNVAEEVAEKLFEHYWNEPETLAGLYHEVDWVPWGAGNRRAVFNDVNSLVAQKKREFQQQIQELKAAQGQDAEGEDEGAGDQQAKIDELTRWVETVLPKVSAAIKEVQDHEALAAELWKDPDAKTPNAACTKMLELHRIRTRENREEDKEKKKELSQKRGDAAMAAYEALQAVDDKTEIPLRWSVVRRLAELAHHEHRVKMLEDELRNEREGKQGMASAVLWVQHHDRHNWPGDLRDEWERNLAKGYNEALSKHIDWQIENGNPIDEQLLRWMVHTKKGRGWLDAEWGQATMKKIIDQRLLYKDDVRVFDADSIATNYVRLVKDYFPGLGEDYPHRTHFAPWYVQEADDRGLILDQSYWNFEGRDNGEGVITKWLTDQWKNGRNPVTDQGDWEGRLFSSGHRETILAYLKGETLNREQAGWSRIDRYHHDQLRDNKETRENFFNDLKAYTEFTREQPFRYTMPSLFALYRIDHRSFNDAEIDVLLAAVDSFLVIRGNWTGHHRYSHHRFFVHALHSGLLERGRHTDLMRVMPSFWKIALENDHRRNNWLDDLGNWTQGLAKSERYNLAAAYATAGLDIVGPRIPSEVRERLALARSRSFSYVGGIPVKRSDPRYAMFSAQLAYQGGNTDKAWKAYKDNRNLLDRTFKDLDLSFLVWIIERHTRFEEFDAAEGLARTLIRFVDSGQAHFDPAQRGELFLAYANIALARQEYPRARAQFERIAATPEFAGTRVEHEANIRIAEILRITREYDNAIKLLEELSESQDPYLRVNSLYQLARIHFDRDEFTEAKENLDRVLMISPDHAPSRLLEGEVKLKLKKLEEATQLEIGLTSTQRIIVPGKPLRVKLEDKNLAVVGKSTNIQIRAWTDHGDEEFFNLYPFGDTRTDFQGSIPTELAPVKKDDHTLQLLGDDVVYYDYSDDFKQKAGITREDQGRLEVVSDAALQASATEILSQEELEERRLRAMLAQQRRGGRRARSTLMEERQRNSIRPGNSFHVRVTDLDRSVTEQPDELEVTVSTTSGDSIRGLKLRENGATSAQFDGNIQTAASPPIAFASDSPENVNPNFAISPKDYPAWTGALDSQPPKSYGVDMNDNVALDVLRIQTEPGRKPTKFLVQTAFNADAWQTVGGYPEFSSWNGALQAEILPLPGDLRSDDEDGIAAKRRQYLDWGWQARGQSRWVQNLNAFDLTVSRNMLERGRPARIRYGTPFIIRVRGAFYVDRHRRHVFSVKPSVGGEKNPYSVSFSVDGHSPGEDESKVPVTLEKGVHVATMTITGKVHKQTVNFKLMVDTEQAPFIAPFDRTLFDRKAHPRIAEAYDAEPATIAELEDGGPGYSIDFPDGSQARLFRLIMLKFEGDAPGFRKLHLTDRDGNQVLPTKQDFGARHNNEVLEIVPGDRVTVEYTDPSAVSSNRKHARFLDVSYNDAEVSAAFLEYTRDRQGERAAEYIQMIRFLADEPIIFLIQDPDADTTPKRDTVQYKAWTTAGEPTTYEALETEAHSGAFVGRVFPVEREPERDSEIQVLEGDQIFFSYLDKENTDPGIPWQRAYAVPQVFWQDPEVRLFDSEVIDLNIQETAEELSRRERRRQAGADDSANTVATTMPPQALKLIRPQFMDEGLESTALVDGPKIVELTFPTITLSPESTATIYAQTETARRLAAEQAGAGEDEPGPPPPEAEGDAPPFDVTVPGTIALTRTAASLESLTIPGFRTTTITGIPEYREDALIEGIYTFTIPTALGDVPEESLVGKTFVADDRTEEAPQNVLRISGADTIHVGFKYEDEAGEEQWITGSFDLESRAGFQIYDRRYENVVDGMYVGETLYFEVINKAMDATAARDEVVITLTAESGTTVQLPLKETFEHTGVFRGLLTPVYQGKNKTEETTDGGEFGLPDLPVVYGDVITATYGEGDNAISKVVNVHKGADGELLAFTKRFEDDDIAVQTQFTIAEAYFELAKKHRNLNQEELAKREILQGKRLLEEAIRDFPESEIRAQADYLLANLALEFGNDAKDQDRKMDYYNEAIQRFTDIVTSGTDTTYAPKAQYKKALTYEKMEKLDKACEEYVKLSYRYPDNELVAETISRLGRYFWKKGKSLNAEAKTIEDEVQRFKKQQQAKTMYSTSAEVFGRLAARFPSHDLAGKTQVLSGQAYIQAGEPAKAIKVLKAAIKTYDGDKTLVPQAMYWCADAYMRGPDTSELPSGEDPLIEAYRMFKNLTWDYPASNWAKYARGRLTTEAMAKAAEASTEQSSR